MSPRSRTPSIPPPPGSSARARAVLSWFIRPVERFLAVEAASGVLLLAATAMAMVWANSPWAGHYTALWNLPVGVSFADWSFVRPLHFWVNDGLMAVFFFVVGLEIKREIVAGELSSFRRALLPLGAALGGMLVPALIFVLFVPRGPDSSAWGVPMATDIAFAVGILALLGKRVPPALRVFLLSLAVIDDLGAIIVIAVFYSDSLQWTGIAVAGAGFATVVLFQRLGIRSLGAYLAAAIPAWAGTYAAGIHPTIAGVILGLLTPTRFWLGAQGFQAGMRAELDRLGDDTDSHATAAVSRTAAHLAREAISPVDRLLHALHPWVAFGIMPVFALANAGVAIEFDALREHVPLLLGVGLGLALGKPIGVLLMCRLLVALRWGSLPTGVGWRQLTVAGLVAGIGFTMAIFIAGLALPDPRSLAAAKFAILVASTAAAIIGFLAGRALLSTQWASGTATTATEAERSTES